MTELVVVRAQDEHSLVAEMRHLIAFLDRFPDVSLLDVAYTCSLSRGPCVVAIVADGVIDLRDRLFSAQSRIDAGTVQRLRDKSGTYYFREPFLGAGGGKLAFLYPGVPGFYPDMLRDLAIAQPVCRGAFEELEEAMSGNSEFTPSSFIFPPAPYYRHDADIFKSGAYAQALVSTYAACAAFTRLLKQGGLVPDGVAGFAGGDLAAMVQSGAAGENLTRADRVRIISDIYGIVLKAVNHGGLAAVAVYTALLRNDTDADELIKSMPADRVMLTIELSPRQKTLVVDLDYEEQFVAAFAAAGIRIMKLPLDRPFNTTLAEGMVPAIRKFADRWMKHTPVYDVYSCALADKVDSSSRVFRKDMAGRWALPVRFADTILKMHEDGYRVFLEVGPRGLMTAAVEDTLKGRPHAAVAMNSVHRSGTLQLQHAFAQLAALNAELDVSILFGGRHARTVDFDAALSMEVRRDSEMRLSRLFPRLTLLSPENVLGAAATSAEPRARGNRAAVRAAAIAQQKRRQRQFDFGAMNPLVSDADLLQSSPGVSVEITKVFKLSELPFIGDFALGTSQLSYADPNLKGLVLLCLPVGAEIMAETAEMVAPNRYLLRIEELECRRNVSFVNGELKLFILAERVASGSPSEIAVKVQLRDDTPNSAYTAAVMEATFVLSDDSPAPRPASPTPLTRPRTVHWSGRDIYPSRLSCGRRIRGISFVESWSESGVDYSVTVPPLADNVVFTRFPMWVVNPLLLASITSGFPLWRSHERFTGAFSFPFRMRRMTMSGILPKEGATLKCYLRLTGVTPKSHLSDFVVTDGNGQVLLDISGWEELTERVPSEYRDIILQPANSFLTESLSAELLGDAHTDVASAFVTNIPYKVFERNDALWLRALAGVVLSADERELLSQKQSATIPRRVEWLFGRIAAKEAVRRFLKDFYQARWSCADVQIWSDNKGKPVAYGAWNDYLSTKIDISISHTSQFVVAVAAANSRVGVDVEALSRNLSDEFSNGVFSDEEKNLAATFGPGAPLKFWSAKEAVSKALGTGISFSPRDMVIVACDMERGLLTVHLEGKWLEMFKNFRGRDIFVTVRSFREHSLATCFIPDSLFGDN